MRRVVGLAVALTFAMSGGVAFAERGPVKPHSPNPGLCESSGLFFDPMTRTCTDVDPNPNSGPKKPRR